MAVDSDSEVKLYIVRSGRTGKDTIAAVQDDTITLRLGQTPHAQTLAGAVAGLDRLTSLLAGVHFAIDTSGKPPE